MNTESSVSVIDASYRDRLVASPWLGSTDISSFETNTPALYRCPELSVGAIRTDLQGVGCVDLGMMKRITGEQCDGILGMNFWQNYVVSLDFDKQTLTTIDRFPEDLTKGAAVTGKTNRGNLTKRASTMNVFIFGKSRDEPRSVKHDLSTAKMLIEFGNDG